MDSVLDPSDLPNLWVKLHPEPISKPAPGGALGRKSCSLCVSVSCAGFWSPPGIDSQALQLGCLSSSSPLPAPLARQFLPTTRQHAPPVSALPVPTPQLFRAPPFLHPPSQDLPSLPGLLCPGFWLRSPSSWGCSCLWEHQLPPGSPLRGVRATLDALSWRLRRPSGDLVPAQWGDPTVRGLWFLRLEVSCDLMRIGGPDMSWEGGKQASGEGAEFGVTCFDWLS